MSLKKTNILKAYYLVVFFFGTVAKKVKVSFLQQP